MKEQTLEVTPASRRHLQCRYGLVVVVRTRPIVVRAGVVIVV